jgi:glutathione peroxidase
MKPLYVIALLAAAIFPASAGACPELLNHKFTTLQGGQLDLCRHAGKPILVVNTASKCGYTPQFEKLEALNRKHKDKLLVVGFPSNDFNQELATNKEIAQFCRLTYAIEFPMVEKASVTGPDAMQLYRQLHTATGQAPQWNFHKYLIAPDGKTVFSFATAVEPDSRELLGKLSTMLK